MSIRCPPDEPAVLVVATMACGVAGGLLWIALWRRTGAPFLVVLMPGLVAGALLGSILLYTPLGPREPLLC